jgi:hypothetical protein
MDLTRVVRLKEDDFVQSGEHAYAPRDHEDALDNYWRVLEVVGDISAQFIAPRAREVDRQGASFKDGEVRYAQGTQEALDRLAKADLMGFTLPRQYGGINFPKTIYSMAIEIISRADASLMNLFGLQEIADTIAKFGSEEQKQKYLPKFCSGETSGAMALTEPDAGSDLQSIALRADLEQDGTWRLNGVKRFITNGCADVSLVMARSEPKVSGGRGISLFIYERDRNMKIRRIEKKLGIHGSPTCELQFNNAPAELLGKRKMGLVKYTMSLMNGARLGVAAQAVGIAEAAYREAYAYARERTQFKKPILEFAAVYEMLTDMRVSIEAGRSLLYETSKVVDIKEGLEDKIERHPELKDDLKEDLKRYTRWASLLTPLVKGFTSEMVNKVCYDAIQVHGGTGYTTDFNVERYYRDARITNIYEGTTQLQVIAAIGGVMTGVVTDILNVVEDSHDFEPVRDLFAQAQTFRAWLEETVAHVKAKNDAAFQEFHARRIVDMAADTIMCYLTCVDGLHSGRKKDVARAFISMVRPRLRSGHEAVMSDEISFMTTHPSILHQQEELEEQAWTPEA